MDLQTTVMYVGRRCSLHDDFIESRQAHEWRAPPRRKGAQKKCPRFGLVVTRARPQSPSTPVTILDPMVAHLVIENVVAIVVVETRVIHSCCVEKQEKTSQKKREIAKVQLQDVRSPRQLEKTKTEWKIPVQHKVQLRLQQEEGTKTSAVANKRTRWFENE